MSSTAPAFGSSSPARLTFCSSPAFCQSNSASTFAVSSAAAFNVSSSPGFTNSTRMTTSGSNILISIMPASSALGVVTSATPVFDFSSAGRFTFSTSPILCQSTSDSRAPAVDKSKAPAFGSSSAARFTFCSSPAFCQSNSASVSSAPAFNVSSSPAFTNSTRMTTSGSNVSTSIMTASSALAVGTSTTPVFDFSSAGRFTFSTSPILCQSTSASVFSLSGAPSSSAFTCSTGMTTSNLSISTNSMSSSHALAVGTSTAPLFVSSNAIGFSFGLSPAFCQSTSALAFGVSNSPGSSALTSSTRMTTSCLGISTSLMTESSALAVGKSTPLAAGFTISSSPVCCQSTSAWVLSDSSSPSSSEFTSSAIMTTSGLNISTGSMPGSSSLTVGTSTAPVFCSSSAALYTFSSSATFCQSTPASAFGVSSAPAFGPSSGPAFTSSTIPSFSQSTCAHALGNFTSLRLSSSSTPSFSSTQAFCQSTFASAIEVSTASSLGASSIKAFDDGFSAYVSREQSSSSVFSALPSSKKGSSGTHTTTGALGSNSHGPWVVSAEHVGSRILPYTETADQFGCDLACITAMNVYKNKSLEELRWEDYQLMQEGSSRSHKSADGPSFCLPSFSPICDGDTSAIHSHPVPASCSLFSTLPSTPSSSQNHIVQTSSCAQSTLQCPTCGGSSLSPPTSTMGLHVFKTSPPVGHGSDLNASNSQLPQFIAPLPSMNATARQSTSYGQCFCPTHQNQSNMFCVPMGMPQMLFTGMPQILFSGRPQPFDPSNIFGYAQTILCVVPFVQPICVFPAGNCNQSSQSGVGFGNNGTSAGPNGSM